MRPVTGLHFWRKFPAPLSTAEWMRVVVLKYRAWLPRSGNGKPLMGSGAPAGVWLYRSRPSVARIDHKRPAVVPT